MISSAIHAIVCTAFLLVALLTPAVAQGPPPEACPLGAPAMTVTMPNDQFAGVAGEPVDVDIEVDPPDLPPGFYLVSLVTPLSKPDGASARVLPGVPQTTITSDTPGEYRFRFMVNLVAKSSCAGAKAATLAEREITVLVSE